jgi:hypothetical protein
MKSRIVPVVRPAIAGVEPQLATIEIDIEQARVAIEASNWFHTN